MSMDIRRGDIVIVDLDPTAGSEQRGTRPCLVVQNDVGNANAPTTIVAPFTTAFDDAVYPFEVHVPAATCSLAEDSVVDCSQLRSISIAHCIDANLGSIPDDRLQAVDRALEYSLGLIEV